MRGSNAGRKGWSAPPKVWDSGGRILSGIEATEGVIGVAVVIRSRALGVDLYTLEELVSSIEYVWCVQILKC